MDKEPSAGQPEGMKINEHIIAEHYLCGGGSHKYVEDQVIENCTVQILRCSVCGKLSIGWRRNGDKNRSE